MPKSLGDATRPLGFLPAEAGRRQRHSSRTQNPGPYMIDGAWSYTKMLAAFTLLLDKTLFCGIKLTWGTMVQYAPMNKQPDTSMLMHFYVYNQCHETITLPRWNIYHLEMRSRSPPRSP